MIGAIKACREGIARTKERGHTSDAAAWLLDQVDVEQDQGMIIGLVEPIAQWAKRLSEQEKKEWLAWALQNKQDRIRSWMGYADDWSMMPADALSAWPNVKRIMLEGLPCAYLVPGIPRQQDKEKKSTMIEVGKGMVLSGVKLKTKTYVLYKDVWYLLYSPKLPSESAICRAVRLFILSTLIGRTVTTTKALYKYEVMAVREWLFQGVVSQEVLGEVAARALYHLVTEPEIVRQLGQ